ncbi:MAG: GGDEF domain-containing protein, partial [Lachnospiraceae bacterium]|nr:GGDEF domain-containing protein [Lachnospiraceae bacterium]
EAGAIITTLRALSGGGGAGYLPAGQLEADLKLSLREGVAVMGEGIYHTDTGAVYTIFWPVNNQEHMLIGVVCMEFDANIIYLSHRQAGLYSLGLSAALFVLISVIAYVSMSRVTESTYKKLAYTDLLTGYENRMAFEHYLRKCGDLAEQGTNVTLIICDVNNLKTINDNQGHEAGDTYLKNTADLIYENLGAGLPLYRIGGDEFASIIAGKRESDIRRIMQSLRDERRVAYKTQLFSCACGAATFIKGVDESMRDVFKRADEAMYEEKKRQKGLA